MDRNDIEKCIVRLRQEPEKDRPFPEVSGGWTIERLQELRDLGPLGVSMGSLTHTTRFLDIGLDFDFD